MSQAIRRMLAVAIALAADGLAAQTPTIFGETVEVRVVNLEVEVTDRGGFPVTGLAAVDFELKVDDETVPIRYFTEIRGGTAVAGDDADAAINGVPALVPGEPVGTSYLVFVDDFFPLARDRDRVLGALRGDVGRLRPEDRMAIVAFDGDRLAMLSSWTQSQRQLERALRTAVGRPAYGLRRVSERRSMSDARRGAGAFDRVGGRFSRLDTRLGVTERFYAELLERQLDNMVSAVSAALRGFANPPGRKVLLLLSGGWPYDISEYVANEFGRIAREPGVKQGGPLYAPITDTANQVGYSVFPVDLPGFASHSLTDSEPIAPREGSERFTSFLRENNEQYTLQRVAAETGGRALLDARRLEALAAAEAATRTYYWIGFEPSWQGDDGRHSVDVGVLREGLKVRSRGSYVDFSRSREVTAAVESVLLFGSGPGVLPLALAVGEPTPVSSRVMRVPISLEIPTAQLTLLPSADGPVAELELRVAAVDDHGGRSDIPVVPMRVVVGDEGSRALATRYQTLLDLRRVRNRIVVAVYDPVAGNLWSATAEVEP